MSFTLQTHKPVRSGRDVKGMRVTPYVRLRNQDDYVILQSGAFYDIGGQPIDEKAVPKWAWDQLKTMNPEVLREVQMDGRTQPGKPVKDL